MSLKRVIKPEDMENHLSEMPMARSVGVQEIDLTKTVENYEQMLDALSQRFDNQFLPMAIAADQRRIVAETAREAAKAAKLAQAPEPNLLLMYAHALASNDPLAKNAFLEHQTIETLNTILNEISGKEKHYNSVFGFRVGYALDTLRYHIATHPASKPSLVERIKNSLGI